MNEDLELLQNSWDNNKNNKSAQTTNFSELYSMIQQKEKDNYRFYYGTIGILLGTLIIVCLFFYFLAPVQETLSRIGASLMITSLSIRILIEVNSIYKAKRIKPTDNTLSTAQHSIHFHQLRKKIHQIADTSSLAVYTIGFYLISPEFSLYIDFVYLLLIDFSYIIIGVILFIVIRKGVKKEIQHLEEIIKLRDEIME